jgi:tetratricopeptide (TPR) repeat protein
VLRVLEGYDRAVEAASDGLRVTDGDDDAAVWLWGEKGDALQLWGIERRAPDRLAEALEAFEAAARKIQGPALSWLYELTGRTLEGLDRRQEALQQFEQAIDRDAASVTAHYALGRLLLRLGENRRALDVFGRLLELAGGSEFETMQAHVGRAVAFRALGDEGEAQRSLSAALGSESVDDYLWRALYLQELGEEELSDAELRATVKRHPEAGSVLNALAWRYADGDPSPARLAEALELARRAVENFDEEEEQYVAFDTLGWVLFKLGRHDEAAEWLKRAVDVNPYDLALREHLEQAKAALTAA